MTSGSASTYQWSLDGQVVRNDSNSQFNISYIDISSTTQGGTYNCTIYTNDNSVISSVNSVLITFAPLITVSPQSTSYLPFLNIESRSTVSNLTGVDDDAVSVTLPSQLHFGSNTFTTAYVSVI